VAPPFKGLLCFVWFCFEGVPYHVGHLNMVPFIFRPYHVGHLNIVPFSFGHIMLAT